MKVKELKPILEVLDDDAEVEFTIVNHSREPKNEFHKPKKEFRDNYRTCRPYIFGHATSIEDPSGLTVECWPIYNYNSTGLVGYLRKTGIKSFCDQNHARTMDKECWKRVSRSQYELLEAISDFVCEEYDSYRDEFQTLFTLENDRYFAQDDLPEFDNEEEDQDYLREYHSIGIVPLVYFVK